MTYRELILLFALAGVGLLECHALGEGLDWPRLGDRDLRGQVRGAGSVAQRQGVEAQSSAMPPPRLAPAAEPEGPGDRARLPKPETVRLGSSGPGMTLAELEEMAQRCSPAMAKAAARIEAARGEWIDAGLYPNPTAGYMATEINDEHRAGQQGGFVGQEIVTAGKLKRARDAAAQAVRQAECALEAERCRVVNDVRQAFYDALVAQRTVELSDRLVCIAEEGVRAAESLVRAKEASRVDLLQSRIEVETSRITAERARNRCQAVWRSLAAVVGTADLPPCPLAGDLQDGLTQWCWNDAIQHVLADSPTLAEARSGVARAQAVLARECAKRAPNVDLQTAVQYDNATRDAIVSVQAGVAIPWSNKNQGRIRAAEAELAVAQGEVRRVALNLQQRLAVTFERYQNARYKVERYASEILPGARTSLDLVTAGYREGELGYAEFLMAQRTFFQVNLAYVEAIGELRLASVAIEGCLLADSLEQR